MKERDASRPYTRAGRRLRLFRLLAILILLLAVFPKRPDDPSSRYPPYLPLVLMIGDSISMGYTPYVADALRGHAIVEHIPDNGHDTNRGLERLDNWLGEQEWDLIHFNWGLWDLMYRHPESKNSGKRDKVRGTQRVAPDRYRANLNVLVDRLKQADALLIWARTTFVPEGEPGRFAGDEERYNEIADSVMQANGIEIDDIYSLTADMPARFFVAPGDVHYTGEGYARIAEEVTTRIRAALDIGDDG